MLVLIMLKFKLKRKTLTIANSRGGTEIHDIVS